MAQLIAYHRVSTQRQGQSGLELEAQQAAVAAYAATTRSDLLASYTEVESGRKSDRPELAKAIRHAKRLRATLVLPSWTVSPVTSPPSRTSWTRASSSSRAICPRLTASRCTSWQRWQKRKRSRSARVREALAAAKARGTKLGASRVGHPTFPAEHQARGAAASAKIRADEQRECYSEVLPIALELSEEGLSLREIGARLDADGHATRLGKPWTTIQVSRLLKAEAHGPC